MKPFFGIENTYGEYTLISVNAISDVTLCDDGTTVRITMTNGDVIVTKEDFENIQTIWQNCYK